jgi:hypothetical protein
LIGQSNRAKPILRLLHQRCPISERLEKYQRDEREEKEKYKSLNDREAFTFLSCRIHRWSSYHFDRFIFLVQFKAQLKRGVSCISEYSVEHWRLKRRNGSKK